MRRTQTVRQGVQVPPTVGGWITDHVRAVLQQAPQRFWRVRTPGQAASHPHDRDRFGLA